MPKILIAEDDSATRRGIALALTRHHFEVLETDCGESVLDLVATARPDILVLDIRLNGADGFRVCRKLRKSGCDIPIIFLTGRAEEDDRVRGLKMAEDYITKPFSLRELHARIDIQLRRRVTADVNSRLRFGEIEIDFAKLTATRKLKPLKLTAREFEILRHFAEHESKLVRRGELLEAVWKQHPETTTRTVDMHILKLRRKIEPNPKFPTFLRSVWGEGYRFVR